MTTTITRPIGQHPQGTSSWERISAQVELIIPEIATEMLRRFTGNRKPKVAGLRKIERAILADRFLVTNQGIGVDWNGNTIDGWHRLTSIVKTGIAVRTLVVRGLDPEVFTVVDIGTGRSPKDTLDILGVERSTADLAAAFKVLKAYVIARSSGKTMWTVMPAARLENYEVHAWLMEHADMADYILPAKRAAKLSAALSSPAAVAAAFYVASRANAESVDEYIKGFIDGANLDAKDQPLQLRNRTTSVSGVNGSGESGQASTFMLAARSLRYWLDGAKTQLKVTKAEPVVDLGRIEPPVPVLANGTESK